MTSDASTFTPAELAAIPRLAPEFAVDGERQVSHSRADLEALVLRYPSHFRAVIDHYTGAKPNPLPEGTDPMMARRYPASPEMFGGKRRRSG